MKVLKRKLKACPLCGALNVRTTHTCYICGWHGQFDVRQTTIERSLDELTERSPELLQVLECASSQSVEPSRWFRIWNWLRSRVRRFDRSV